MIATDSTIPLSDLDRSDWKTYRFNQIAFSISERVEPQQTDLDIYIGLEHIDAESLHIKRWGTPGDVEGTKLRVYPGDVIFGKRRAYQRKAAIAEFDGICSAHAMVLRTNPSVIEPRLFPFFLHSDLFMHRAIDISVGSLSPTINWGTLKDQEFLLPPLDQQAQLAELLWAADEVVERYRELFESIKFLKNSLSETSFKDSDNYTEVGEIARVTSGGTPDRKTEEFWNGNIPWIKTTEINYNDIYESEEYITEIGLQNSSAKIIPRKSLLMAMYGQGVTRGRVARLCIDATVNQACAAIIPFDETDLDYLYYFFEYAYELVRDLAQGANQQNLSGGIIKAIKLPYPDSETRITIAERLKTIDVNLSRIKQTQTEAITLKNALINQIFAG